MCKKKNAKLKTAVTELIMRWTTKEIKMQLQVLEG